MYEGESELIQIADVENLIKTRRSLLIASIATLIFANLTIISSKFTFFDLEVLISQKNIVQLGQAGTLYLLAVFLLQAVPEFIKVFGWIWDTRINSLERKAWRNFSYEWNMNDEYDDESVHGPDADSDFIKSRFAQLRNKKTSWIEMLSVTSLMIANLFVAYLSPVIAAAMCLFWPTALRCLLS